jgi:hypothetical protein
MPIKLLPYTQGVSSTMLRAQLLQGAMKPNNCDHEPNINGIVPATEKKNQ